MRKARYSMVCYSEIHLCLILYMKKYEYFSDNLRNIIH